MTPISAEAYSNKASRGRAAANRAASAPSSCFRIGGHSFFAHGFAKSDKANVTPRELKALKRLAEIFLAFSTTEIAVAVGAGQLVEVTDGDDEEQG